MIHPLSEHRLKAKYSEIYHIKHDHEDSLDGIGTRAKTIYVNVYLDHMLDILSLIIYVNTGILEEDIYYFLIAFSYGPEGKKQFIDCAAHFIYHLIQARG